MFLATSKMLMGVDIEQISVIVFVRVLNQMHYLLQGAGRGGRKSLSGKRNKVVVYILYNSSDVANNVPGLSSEVREFCRTKECLKRFMRLFFDKDETAHTTEWCCNNCD